jgi:hypothetical protein
LKLTKSRRRSKYDLNTINFDNIDACNVKYSSPSFDGDILFVFSRVSMGVLDVYGCFVDGMDKMYDGHP